MSTRRRAVEVLIGAKDRSKQVFDGVLRRTKTWAVQMQDPAKVAALAIGGVGTALLTVPAALAAVSAGTGVWLQRLFDLGDRLDKMSQRTDISVESLSTLTFAMEQNGETAEVLEQGLRGLVRNADAAATGNGEAADSFRALGITVTDVNGHVKDTEQLLLEVADAMSGYEDDASKAAAAQRIFGESGQRMLPFLNQGADGIRALQKQARDLGAEISTEFAKNSAKFNDNINRLQTAVSVLGISIANELLPDLIRMSDEMVRAYTEGGLIEAALTGAAGAWDVFRRAVNGNLGEVGAMQQKAQDLRVELDSLNDRARRLGKISRDIGPTAEGDAARKALESVERQIELVTTKLRSTQKGIAELKEFSEEDFPEGEFGPKPGLGPTAAQRIAKQAADREAQLEQQKKIQAEADAKRKKEQEASAKSRADNALISSLFGESESALREILAAEAKEEADLQRKRDFAKRVIEEEELRAAEDAERIQIRQQRELEQLEGFEQAQTAVRSKYAAERAQLRRQVANRELSDAQSALGALGQLTEAFGSSSVNSTRRFSSALALIATLTGGAQALSDPKLSPLAKFAIAARTIAFGKGLVDQIKGVGSDGGGSVGTAAYGGGFPGSASSPAPAPEPVQQIQQEQQRALIDTLVIDVRGDLVDPDTFAEKITRKIEELSFDGKTCIQAVKVNR